MAVPDRTSESRRTTRGATGWVMFAAVMMIVIGFLNFFYGLAAIVNDQVVVVGGHGAIIADLTTWGWITLILGIVLVAVGFGLFVEAGWARWTAVFVVALNAIEQVWIFTAAPLWALIVIFLDTLIIYNLIVRWAEPV